MSDNLEENVATMSSQKRLIGNWPHIINMANSIIGVSVLALPFCFKECGIFLGFLLLMASAWLTRLTCHLLMKSAFATKKRSYEYLAFYTFGRSGKLVVELSIIGLLIGTCIAFYIIIGDLGPAVVSKVTGLENTSNLRSVLLVLLTAVIVLPLAMLHNLESLSNFSAISLTFYCVFVAEVIFAAFPNLWSGIWLSKVSFWNTDGVFKCLPIFALCFACQTQLFLMSDSLPEPSLNRINRIVHSAIVTCSVIYVAVGFFGYIAFCDDYISGDILMNFPPTFFSEAIKLGFVTSTLISFPLVIFPCRASIYTLLFVRKGVHDNFGGAVYIPTSYFKLITVSIIGVTLVTGLLVPNVEFMLAITGATMGSLICYIIPAVLFISVISGDNGGNTRSFAQLVLLIGITILLASSYVTLTGPEKVAKHDSVVKVGQPIEHNEGNLPIHDDEELKKKLEEMKNDAIVKDEKNMDLEQAKANENPLNNGAVGGVKTAPPTPPIKILQVTDLSIDEIKLKESIDKKEPEKETDKRQEPPNPHAPVDEVVVENKDKIGDVENSDKDSQNITKKDLMEENQKSPNVHVGLEQPQSAEKSPHNAADANPGQDVHARPVLSDVLEPQGHGQPAVMVVDMKNNVKREVVPHSVVNESLPKQVLKVDSGGPTNRSRVSVNLPGNEAVSPVEVQKEPARKNEVVSPVQLQNEPARKNEVVSPVQAQDEPARKNEIVSPVQAQDEPARKNSSSVPEQLDREHVKAASDDKEKHEAINQHEANIIIAQLKKHQEEQRKLLDEQRKIIDDLKRHQIEVHREQEPKQDSKLEKEDVKLDVVPERIPDVQQQNLKSNATHNIKIRSVNNENEVPPEISPSDIQSRDEKHSFKGEVTNKTGLESSVNKNNSSVAAANEMHGRRGDVEEKTSKEAAVRKEDPVDINRPVVQKNDEAKKSVPQNVEFVANNVDANRQPFVALENAQPTKYTNNLNLTKEVHASQFNGNIRTGLSRNHN